MKKTSNGARITFIGIRGSISWWIEFVIGNGRHSIGSWNWVSMISIGAGRLRTGSVMTIGVSRRSGTWVGPSELQFRQFVDAACGCRSGVASLLDPAYFLNFKLL